jgi:hypothetical protein
MDVQSPVKAFSSQKRTFKRELQTLKNLDLGSLLNPDAISDPSLSRPEK